MTRSAECTGAALAPVLDGLEIAVDRGVEYPAPAGCFFGEHGALLAQPEEGLLLLGGSAILRNDEVLRADNAAVALRLLGQHERLVWYVPDFADLDSAEAVSLATLLPDWLRPGLWLAALAMVAVLLWRGRRLGPLATEPLPVVVKAIETTRSRGRLYRKADDRAHAAAALRDGRAAPLAEHLRLPAGAAPETLVRDVARHVGRPVAEIGGLLHPAAPAAGDRPRPDHAGHRAGRARQRGTPPMTDQSTPATDGTGPTTTRCATGWPRSGPRWRRPWSARTPPCRGCWSRCCAAATC